MCVSEGPDCFFVFVLFFISNVCRTHVYIPTSNTKQTQNRRAYCLTQAPIRYSSVLPLCLPATAATRSKASANCHFMLKRCSCEGKDTEANTVRTCFSQSLNGSTGMQCSILSAFALRCRLDPLSVLFFVLLKEEGRKGPVQLFPHSLL